MGTRQHGHKLNESGLEHYQVVKILRNKDSLEAQLMHITNIAHHEKG
jgi:hypothetical protein